MNLYLCIIKSEMPKFIAENVLSMENVLSVENILFVKNVLENLLSMENVFSGVTKNIYKYIRGRKKNIICGAPCRGGLV